MKKTLIAVLLGIFSTAVMTAQNSKAQAGTDGNKYIRYEQRTGNESVVYFTRNLSAEGLIKAYEQVSEQMQGHIGVKLHTGEPNGPNIIPSGWVKELIKKDLPNASIIETNTYYEGDRYTTEKHRKTLKVNGWTFCPVDIMDEEGTTTLPVNGGKWFKEMTVGSHLKNYNSMVTLTHFKGHTMGGFGGANKNIGIGCADGRIGKAWIHSHPGNMWDVNQEELMERIAESTKATIDFVGKPCRVSMRSTMALCSVAVIAYMMARQAWSMARMSLEERIPTSGVTTGSAALPSQSQDTDMLRMTLT